MYKLIWSIILGSKKCVLYFEMKIFVLKKSVLDAIIEPFFDFSKRLEPVSSESKNGSRIASRTEGCNFLGAKSSFLNKKKKTFF